jgi:hypothetical protein
MTAVQLTLGEIDMIATYVLHGAEVPFSAAFEAATAKFYGEDGFDASDEKSMSRVTVVDLPTDALNLLPDRLYGVADDMDLRAKAADKAKDYSSAELLHRGAGKLRALAVHTRRQA